MESLCIRNAVGKEKDLTFALQICKPKSPYVHFKNVDLTFFDTFLHERIALLS